MQKVALIVPCYNESQRLPLADFKTAIGKNYCHWFFVDDGSTDNTFQIISSLQKEFPGQLTAIKQPQNGGKSEAVRAGLNHALNEGYEIVAFADADLATPTAEIERLLPLFNDSRKQVGMAARVQLLGTHIERKTLRHFLGRIFATLASLLLNLRVYDTQCGFKLFRSGAAIRRSLEIPFTSRWSFDVELIGRLLENGLTVEDFIEMPLQNWCDVRGSKLGLFSMLQAGFDLLRIGFQYRIRCSAGKVKTI